MNIFKNFTKFLSPKPKKYCSIPGCTKPAYIDEKGYVYPNCGQTCGNVIIKNSKTHITSKLNKLFPSIRVLSEEDSNYKKIQNEFLKSIVYIKIVAIIRIKPIQEKRIKRSKLRREMAKFIDKDPKRIKRRLYYGTRASCDPKKVLKNKKACSDQRCEMCSIIKYGTKDKLLRRGKMTFTRRPSIAATFAYNLKNPREHSSTTFIIDILTTNDTTSDVITVERDAMTIPRYLILYDHI
ncbi:19622_t:CDS:2 [Dentiscutata erythropus]|uniref:19622_t:CDS:1 n=1 Tax=Dentiscutata erythropus TaxID=1348616 RepID=A0A9N9BF11_9GLOM|nr:19622_t:CDS:2 [Dentiscutata erythropus]